MKHYVCVIAFVSLNDNESRMHANKQIRRINLHCLLQVRMKALAPNPCSILIILPEPFIYTAGSTPWVTWPWVVHSKPLTYGMCSEVGAREPVEAGRRGDSRINYSERCNSTSQDGSSVSYNNINWALTAVIACVCPCVACKCVFSVTAFPPTNFKLFAGHQDLRIGDDRGRQAVLQSVSLMRESKTRGESNTEYIWVILQKWGSTEIICIPW